MPATTKSDVRSHDRAKAALREENAELRARLAETEETLRAIRSGEVDAITVTTPDGEQVFSLKGAEQPYRVMIETMSEGAVTVMSDGTVLYCNQRFADMTRSDLGTILGSSLLRHFDDDDAEEILAALHTSQTAIARASLKLLASDGTRVPVNVAMHAQVLGGAARIAVVISDLTEVMAAQEETARLNQHLEEIVAARTQNLAKANEELEAANEELKSFSYSVSHDLRAPLRAVDGFSRMLLEDYGDRFDNEGRRRLHIVRESANKMGELIDDILAYSRVGRLEMTDSDVDMDKVVQNALTELTPVIANRMLEISTAKLPHAHGDARMLQRVWMNLLDNAIKYTAPRLPAVIAVKAAQNGRETVFSVKDNGVGFDMKYVGKLFGVFQRLHSPEQFVGTGIGLAIVKRIVARHGGRVWAEGETDKGATFYFTLPSQEVGNG